MRLHQNVAIVTGSGSGIGRSTALLFCREGAKIVIADVNSEGGEETREQILSNGGDAIFVDTDVRNSSSVESMAQKAWNAYGRIDILVNNAGIDPAGSLEDTSEETWNSSIDVNLTGVYRCSKHVVPYMKRANRGSIVNVSSLVAFFGARNRVAYAASKGGVVALTKAMATDLADFNIRVNCVCPGSIWTPMVERAVSEMPDPKKAKELRISTNLIQRLGTPDDVAYAALYFASEESSFLTGEALIVDGGRSCGAMHPKGM